MKITVCCEDLVRRCVWDNYTYYVLGSEKDAERMLKENNEFEISERDALVIGLLKVIETPNLIHKFNTHIVDFLANRSLNQSNIALIRKKTLETSVDKFVDKFPTYWEPNLNYKKGLEDLIEYVKEFKERIDKMDIQKITDQFGTHEYLNSNNVKKILTFNY